MDFTSEYGVEPQDIQPLANRSSGKQAIILQWMITEFNPKDIKTSVSMYLHTLPSNKSRLF